VAGWAAALGWAAAACWAGKGEGLKRKGKSRGFWEFRDLGIGIRKGFKSNRIQTSEFESQQPKQMLQHVCNNKFLYFVNFILEKF
jgi:hypothetical protein